MWLKHTGVEWEHLGLPTRQILIGEVKESPIRQDDILPVFLPMLSHSSTKAMRDEGLTHLEERVVVGEQAGPLHEPVQLQLGLVAGDGGHHHCNTTHTESLRHGVAAAGEGEAKTKPTTPITPNPVQQRHRLLCR